MAADERISLADAAGPLLEGLGRVQASVAGLPERVAEELVLRAAAGLRRCERGSVERARSLLARARDLRTRGSR